jgi:fused signal recognition particle receptor
MLDFFKRKKTEPENAPETPTQKPGLFTRLKAGLTRSREALSTSLASVFLGKKVIDQALLKKLESVLISADLGFDTTQLVIQQLTQKVSRAELQDVSALQVALKDILASLIQPYQIPLVPSDAFKPFVILMIGVNGAGKTTTIGKLTSYFLSQGKKVMLAAGDTFRAAAIEQLKVWGEQHDVPVIAQKSGSDSASVVFDAFQAAKARHVNILIADTAGRLHTQSNLMEELKKVARVLKKLDESAPHEVMLVLDAAIGQNALAQAKAFYAALGVTGITLTKLDGTAKGGIIFNIAQTLKLPVRFIGFGESHEDLKAFDASEFIDALFTEPTSAKADAIHENNE